MSTPSVALAMSSMVALVWAFQQQGWSFCIPGVLFAVRKVARLRWKDVTALTRQASTLAQDGSGRLTGLSIRLHATLGRHRELFFAMYGKPQIIPL